MAIDVTDLPLHGILTGALLTKSTNLWTVEFERRSSQTTTNPPTHSITLIARTALSKWHVRVTFRGELQSDQKSSQMPNWTKRWVDFRRFCHCFDFGQLPLLDDTVTELHISPIYSPCYQPLPLMTLPGTESDYAAFRKTVVWFRVEEYPWRTRYPSYIGVGRNIWFSEVEQGEELSNGIHEAYIVGDERRYAYKSVERDLYVPNDTRVLEQELRNLELFRGSDRIVQLVAAVVSDNPYQTKETEGVKTPVLRGVLLDHHPNGTLGDVLKSPKPWMDGHWQQWGLEITTALSCLHQRGVTHMDLKPENIVMSKEWTAILIDVSGIGGTSRDWVLPELLDDPKPCYASWEVRVQSDTWALGKILSLMAKAGWNSKEKLPLLQTAQAVEQANGLIPLSFITQWLCKPDILQALLD